MPRAVEGDHNTRLTLAVPPSDQGMFALAVGEGAADWLSAAAKGPTRSFPADCSTGPPDQFQLADVHPLRLTGRKGESALLRGGKSGKLAACCRQALALAVLHATPVLI